MAHYLNRLMWIKGYTFTHWLITLFNNINIYITNSELKLNLFNKHNLITIYIFLNLFALYVLRLYHAEESAKSAGLNYFLLGFLLSCLISLVE